VTAEVAATESPVPASPTSTTPTQPVRRETRRTTRQRLLRLRAIFLTLTVTTFATCAAAIGLAHNTIAEIRTHTVPAILEVSAARAALVAADRAAAQSFQIGTTRLTGLGGEYQNQIAIASQNLALVAEHNVAGDDGSEQLRVAEGLLVTYVGMVAQADAQHSPGGNQLQGDNLLSVASLWEASQILHDGDGKLDGSGLLARVNRLRDSQEDALKHQLSSGWLSGRAAALGLTVVMLFLLLLWTQVYLARTFRRRANGWLLAATLLLVLFGAGVSYTFTSQRGIAAAERALSEVEKEWGDQMSRALAKGQQSLAAVMKACLGRCGDTVDAFIKDHPGTDNNGTAVHDVQQNRLSELSEKITDVNTQTAAANSTAHNWLLNPAGVGVTGLVVVALIWLGLRPRIEEYRYPT